LHTLISPMAAQKPPMSAILYQDADRSITLIDIPASIATAQGRSDTLLSTSPLEAPIQLQDDNQPRSLTAQAHKAQESSNGAQHAEYKTLIQQALAAIHARVSGSWCKPRKLLTQTRQYGKDTMDIDDTEKELETRLREWAVWGESTVGDTAFNLQRMMASLGATSEHDATAQDAVTQKWLMSYRPAREVINDAQSAETVHREQLTEAWSPTFHNPEEHCLELTISQNGSRETQLGQEYRFTIPPRSTLFLSDSTHSDGFRASFREVTGEYTLPRHFDLVLMDPPWPNRSAKRKGAYEQTGGMPYLKKMLLKMDIDNYLEHNALVGVWITNKESLRQHVVGPGGLFETWNVGLIEEWIWIKTTTNGEPMFDIDSLSRKPYEILLLGRAAPNSWTTMTHAPFVKRRVIAAVPDVHSRKPCLKELLEPYMPDAHDYSALEVFSRYLISGWTSWGNEVLKYNWDRYWVEPDGGTAPEYRLAIRTV
jgi:N6-adenosine-specific RNA methylase IME4